jgi:hypothetical protein
MQTKHQITCDILATLGSEPALNYDQAMRTWWMNFSRQHSMRLTDVGFETLKSTGIKSYEFDIPVGITINARMLLTLDRKLQCAYFAKLDRKPQLILFGSEQAMMFAMYNDIDKWLQFLDRQ